CSPLFSAVPRKWSASFFSFVARSKAPSSFLVVSCSASFKPPNCRFAVSSFCFESASSALYDMATNPQISAAVVAAQAPITPTPPRPGGVPPTRFGRRTNKPGPAGQDRFVRPPAVQVLGQRHGSRIPPRRILLQALQTHRLQVPIDELTHGLRPGRVVSLHP